MLCNTVPFADYVSVVLMYCFLRIGKVPVKPFGPDERKRQVPDIVVAVCLKHMLIIKKSCDLRSQDLLLLLDVILHIVVHIAGERYGAGERRLHAQRTVVSVGSYLECERVVTVVGGVGGLYVCRHVTVA